MVKECDKQNDLNARQNMKKQTQALHVPYARRDAYDALSMPVYNAVAFEFDNAKVMSDAFCSRIDAPDYSRVENPTVTHFEDRVRVLTGASSVIALSTGMAAISNTLMALCRQGSNVVTSRHLFGNTFSLLQSTLARFGVEMRCCDLTRPEEVAQQVDEQTACIFLEIITNPQMEVADLTALAEVAHAKKTWLVADTTIIPFTQFSAKALGVDIEVVSSTKYISGGATSMGGLVMDYGTHPTFGHVMRNEMLFNLGAYMGAQTAFLQTMGLETLDARYRVQSSNAMELAKRLSEEPVVKRVNYVGLPTNPYHALAQRLYGPTAGAMVCIDLASEAECHRVLNGLKLIHRATNLFDNRSLAIHPASTIFGLFTPEEKRAMDVDDCTLRLSMGLEHVDDLFDDLQQALRQ